MKPGIMHCLLCTYGGGLLTLAFALAQSVGWHWLTAVGYALGMLFLVSVAALTLRLGLCALEVWWQSRSQQRQPSASDAAIDQHFGRRQ